MRLEALTNAVYAIPMVVAVRSFGTLIARNRNFCERLHFPNPGLPRTFSGCDYVIVLSLGTSPKPEAFVLRMNVLVPKNPRAYFAAIHQLCSGH